MSLASAQATRAYVSYANEAAQQKEECKGVVKDVMGETVIGASVRVKGSEVGTITDFDGNFSLPGVGKGQTLIISFIGYQT